MSSRPLLKSLVSCIALALGAAVGLTPPTAEAALMVDMNDAHVAGGDWETIAAPNHDSPITLSDGTALLFVGSSTGAEWSDSTTVQATGGSAYEDTPYEPAASDYLWGAASSRSLVLGNLDPNVAYTLELISARAASGARTATITANGQAADADVHTGVAFNSYTEGWLEGVVLRWSDLTPSSNGEITLAFDPSSSDSYFVNGFVLVPEPASLAMLGLGGLLLVKRRSRA